MGSKFDNLILILLALYAASGCISFIAGFPTTSISSRTMANRSKTHWTYPSGRSVKRLPDALIIGAKKAGTRALLEFLKLHPDVQAPGPEIHFFDRKYERGLEWYRSKMPPTLDGQISMEKTPAYFVHPQVPARVHAMDPKTKLILVVRDPVTRALSDFSQSLERKGPSIGSFEQHAVIGRSGDINTAWNAIRIGLYGHHLDNWLRYFPISQVHIVSGEQLITNPGMVLQDVQHFLGLSPVINDRHFYYDVTKKFPCVKKNWRTGAPHCLGRNKGRSHPYLRPEVVRNLRDFYRSHNQVFYNMTGIDFGWDQGTNEHSL